MKSVSRALLFLILPILACDEKSELPEYPDLKIYLDRFEEEAKAKGYDFDLSNVQAVYVNDINVNQKSYCGYGFINYDGAGLRRIEISKAQNCGWSKLSDIERENLFFHEIGHAFFNRSHNTATQCDGSPLSLMTTSNLRIYTEAGEKRDYYISELIDPLVALNKCIKDEKDWSKDSVYQLAQNDPDWILYNDNGKYVGTRSAVGEPEEYLSLASIPGINAQANAYWLKTIYSPNIPECAEVKFKVKMNSEELTGNGAAISLRAYKTVAGKMGAVTEEYLQLTTRHDPISGELIDHPEELIIPCYSRATIQLVIFVVLVGETQGEVTFGDIELLVKPK